MSPGIAAYFRFLREHPLLGTVLPWAMILAMVWVIPAALWHGDWPLAIRGRGVPSPGRSATQLPYRAALVPGVPAGAAIAPAYVLGSMAPVLRLAVVLGQAAAPEGDDAGFARRFSGGVCRSPVWKSAFDGPILGLFTVVFGNALGAWWEIAEFLVDKTLKKNTQYGLDNTMIDLINNLLGSLIAAGLGWVYLKVTRREDRRQLAEPLAAVMGPLLSGEIPDEQDNECSTRSSRS